LPPALVVLPPVEVAPPFDVEPPPFAAPPAAGAPAFAELPPLAVDEPPLEASVPPLLAGEPPVALWDAPPEPPPELCSLPEQANRERAVSSEKVQITGVFMLCALEETKIRNRFHITRHWAERATNCSEFSLDTAE
jgi:hypothetical protein